MAVKIASLTQLLKAIAANQPQVLKAAHRFYERIGFERRKSEEIPTYFPRMMPDNVFYHLHLSA